MSENLLKAFAKISNSLRSDSEIFLNNAASQIPRITMNPQMRPKSLSLPGDRIGYLALRSEVEDFENIVAAVAVATRITGFINASKVLKNSNVDISKSSICVLLKKNTIDC